MPDSENTLHRRLQWFLLLRVIITTCLLGMAVFLYYRHGDAVSPAGGWLLSAIGLTYFVSLLSGLLLTQVRNLALFSYGQIVLDTLFVTGIVLLTGGLGSPFAFLYHLATLNAALLLFRRGALVAATLAALCYGTTVNLLYHGILPPLGFDTLAFLLFHSAPSLHLTIQLVAALLSFYAIALLGSYLTQRLSHVETLLAERDTALDQLSSLYKGVVQNLENGVLVTDTAGRVEYANNPMGEILDTVPSLLVGRSVTDFLPPQLTSQPSSQPVEFSIEGNGSGGKEQILRAISALLSDTYGNPIGTLYSVQDVTGIKELERSAQAAEELGQETDPGIPQLHTFAGLVGSSEGMNGVYQLIAKVADSTTMVLITGESGTGKELVARAIHEKGPRANRPFVPVNCGAIPDSLIESELFGHVKGAFTGAVSDRPGLFRQADGGTLFLDEVGELPLALQVKLLRVLQNHEVTPIGGSKTMRVDVRVLAATNKNLEEEVAAGRFREDLFYRLNVIRIALPPLRERRGDLPLLLHHFLTRFCAESGKETHQISPQAMRLLLDYTYPGNIRELENIVQHAVTMTEGETIRSADLPAHIRPVTPQDHPHAPGAERQSSNGTSHDFFTKGVSLDTELEEYEQAILRAALEKTGGVQKRAAEVLGINYRSLRHRLQKYCLS